MTTWRDELEAELAVAQRLAERRARFPDEPYAHALAEVFGEVVYLDYQFFVQRPDLAAQYAPG